MDLGCPFSSLTIMWEADFFVYIIIYACLAAFNFKAAGVSLTHLMLVLLRCFSYTPHASFSEVFHLHSSC